jgi:8-oxo-dGTP diphosphatase
MEKTHRVETLVLITRATGKKKEVLLGRKLSGQLGKGLFNAPGGGIEGKERPRECALREVYEETHVRIRPECLHSAAIMHFYVGRESTSPVRTVHVYITSEFEGEPETTDSMIPEWFDIHALPEAEMHDGDTLWFCRALSAQSGGAFTGSIWYQKDGAVVLHSEFVPYEE